MDRMYYPTSQEVPGAELRDARDRPTIQGPNSLFPEVEEAEETRTDTAEKEITTLTTEAITIVRKIVRSVEPNILNAVLAMATTSVRPNVTHAKAWGTLRTVVRSVVTCQG